MTWSPDRDALRGRVAVVTGATRGAGRGIAAALGEAGATVVRTGRSSGSTRSEYNRTETIEETAALVTRLGGTGIAVAVDHLDPAVERGKTPPTSRSPSRRATSGAPSPPSAADPDRNRWNQQSVSSAQLARAYGFTDLDGSRPDIWRRLEDARSPV